MNFEVKNVKTMPGREGIAFNANLYLDGRKVANVIQNGAGGTATFYWTDRSAAKTLGETLKTLPVLPRDHGLEISYDETLFVEFLVLGFLERKKMTSKTCFATKEGIFSTKAKFTPEVKTTLLKDYPEAVFLNELNQFDLAFKIESYAMGIEG